MIKRFFKSYCWSLVLLTALLVGAGILNQASASSGGILFKKQLIWYAMGSFLLFGLSFVDYQKIFSVRFVFIFYLFFLLLLVFLVIKGDRWLRLPGFSIQPSEFAKLALIFVSSLILHRHEDSVLSWKTFGLLTLFALPLCVLVAATDLDQGMMLFLLYASFVVVAGIPKRILALGVAAALAIAFLAGPYVWKMLQPYQRARVEAFINPEAFALDRGYQVLQALIAVGSGGWTGLGFKQGISSRLNYLPEKHTDLAFAVWAEEWGFIGSTFIVCCFALLIFQILKIACQVRDPLGRYLCFGVAAMFFWEMLINVGGIIHILPIASVPLPFLSYGGSSVLANMSAIGLVLSVSRKRYSFR